MSQSHSSIACANIALSLINSVLYQSTKAAQLFLANFRLVALLFSADLCASVDILCPSLINIVD